MSLLRRKLVGATLAIGATAIALPFGVLADLSKVVGWFTSPYYYPGRDRR